MKNMLPLFLTKNTWFTLNLLFAGLLIQAFQPVLAKNIDSSETVVQQERCKKPMKLKGAPNLMESMAQMRAIIIWSEKVSKKYDDGYAQWHNAQNKSVNCKKSHGSAYYYCDLTATPCLSLATENASP